MDPLYTGTKRPASPAFCYVLAVGFVVVVFMFVFVVVVVWFCCCCLFYVFFS